MKWLVAVEVIKAIMSRSINDPCGTSFDSLDGRLDLRCA